MNHTEEVVHYYSRIGTWLGYDIVLGGAKHLGFYPRDVADISESEAQKLMHDEIARRLKLEKDELVLDAGCGQGIVSSDLAKRYGAHIVGITIVPFEIARAQKSARLNGVTQQTSYELMDYSATTFPDAHFDAIYTTETLSHSPDVARTVQEFHRILKPGGRIALLEYTMADERRFSLEEKTAWNTIFEHAALPGWRQFKHDTFPALLERAGFVNSKEENISKNVLPSLRRLHRLARFVYPGVRALGLQKHFVNTVAGYWWYLGVKKDLFRVCIFSAQKT